MEKKKINKKKFIPPLILILVILAGVAYVVLTTSRHTSTQLSDRAKEYLASLKKKGDTHLEGGSGSSQTAVDDAFRKKGQINECFNFKIPFTISNTYSQGRCNNYFSFQDPRGAISAYLEESAPQSLDDYPAVKLRRQQTDTYVELQQKVGDKNVLFFRNKDISQGVKETSFYSTGGKLFVLNLDINETTPEAQRILNNILSSLVLY